MSEALQFGHHPDPHPGADQIAAFVENALPAHERTQMLDHLALCAECRTVVTLSLPQLEEPAAPVRKPWWSGFFGLPVRAVAWPAAAACAALGLTLVYYHRPSATPSSPPANQISSIHAPASPTASQPPNLRAPSTIPSAPAASSTRRPTASPQNPRPLAAPPKLSVLSRPGSLDQPYGDASASASGSAPGGGLGQGSAVARMMGRGEATGAGGGLASGTGHGYESAKSLQPPQILQAAPATNGSEAGLAVPNASDSNPTLKIMRPANAGVSVAADSPVTETTSTETLDIPVEEAQLQPLPPGHPLPSRQPVLSIAARGNLILAIDARHAVFLSRDAGRHWEAVQPHWQGQPIRAALIQLPALKPVASLQQAQATGGPTYLTGRNAPPAAGSAVAGALIATNATSLTGTVTDRTGAVIPDAIVAVTSPGISRTARTDAAGKFQIDTLPAGSYQVRAQARGFKTQILSPIAVTNNSPAIANVTLDVAEETQTVAVQSSNLALEPQTPPVLADTPMAAQKSKVNFIASPPGIFEITTDSGDRWTSTDGLAWKKM